MKGGAPVLTGRVGRAAAAASLLAAAAVLGACASPPTTRVPYPAFIQAAELEPVFTAALPGSRAQPLFVDGRKGVSSLLLTLPSDWEWNAGGAPGKSVEIYVLEGEIRLGEFALQPGNYAYLPPGSTSLPMSTESGARLLYFLDDADPQSVIRTPLFMSREVVPWQPVPDAGVERKVLRSDPGSGATTALLKFEPGAGGRLYGSSAPAEGFLLSGDYRASACVAGEVVTGEYAPGGYFRRPAGAVTGGAETGSDAGAVWLVREPSRGARTWYDACPAGDGPLGE